MSFIAPRGRVCVIFGAGPFDLPEFDLRQMMGKNPLIICADGGLRNALKAGFEPGIVIGDFDSGDAPRDIPVIRLPAEKDETDLRVCAKYGLEAGCATFYILCCTGGRLDHFLANVYMLEFLHKNGASGYLLDSRNIIGFMGGESRLEFYPHDGFDFVSLIPLEDAGGITLDGLKYPLNAALLTRDNAVGVSNEPAGGKIKIELGWGNLFIVLSK